MNTDAIPLSTFARINLASAARKQAAWVAIEAARKDFRTTGERSSLLPLTPLELGKRQETHDVATEEDKDDEMEVVYRMTEIKAIEHALGKFRFMSEDPVIRIEPVIVTRWCSICLTRHAVDAFERDKRVPGGIAFGCKSGRQKMGKYFFRRSDGKQMTVAA